MSQNITSTVPMVRHSAQLICTILALGCIVFLTAKKAAVQLDTASWIMICSALVTSYTAGFRAPRAERLLTYITTLLLIALYMVTMRWPLVKGLFGPATAIALALPIAALSMAAYQLAESQLLTRATPRSYIWIRIGLACIGYCLLVFSFSSMGQYYFATLPMLMTSCAVLGAFACYSALRLRLQRNAAWWGATITCMVVLLGSSAMVVVVAKPTILLPVVLLCMALYYLVRWGNSEDGLALNLQ